jgi:RHS repeat-associated protein
MQFKALSMGTIATWTQQAGSGPAVVNTLSYDPADQLTNAVQSGGGTAHNAYQYDPAGNRLAEVTGSGTTAGQFNNLNQLTGYSGGAGSQTVAGHTSAPVSSVTVNAVPATVSSSTNFSATVPLPAGTNTLSVVAQPGTGPTTTRRYQFVTPGTAPTALTYDANGNTLTDENGNSYSWDALNRLTQITYPSGASSSFAYDGLSRRIAIIEKNAAGTTTSTKNYLWIGQEIAEERDSSNAVTKRFFPQGEQQAGTDYYYTRDHLGSVREMTNSSGDIASRLSYDPYGRTTVVSGTNLPMKQYGDMYWHQASGLFLPLLRGGYDSNLGRFIQRDLIGENGGINLYDYCLNDTIMLIDPSGLAGQFFFDIGPAVEPGSRSSTASSAGISYLNSCCQNIAFIQKVRGTDNPNWTTDDKPSGGKPAQQPPPYYPYQNLISGGASMTDSPGYYNPVTGGSPWFPSTVTFWQEFETCAVCKDTGQVLGCVRWGHSFKNGQPTRWGPPHVSPGYPRTVN